MVFLLFLASVASYSIEIKSGTTDCFVVKTPTGVPITGSYEVIHPDGQYIGVTVKGPKGFLHFEKVMPVLDVGGKEEEATEGFFSFDAEVEGDYTLCFSNGNDVTNDGVSRIIAFNFRAVAAGEQDYQFVGLQSELADLKEGLDLLKDHQSYMNQREDLHKTTLESINVKVICWTVLEAVILVAMAGWQISYIRSFFETKRRM